MLEIAAQISNHSWLEMVFRGVAAGFLIAAMVWLIPSAETTQFHVVIPMTYLFSASGFMHVVAGSVESFLLLLNGHVQIWPMVSDSSFRWLLATLSGGPQCSL